ncbi:MAG: hypothetical protein ACXWNK_14815 [Vulcanimicrobiaceae bacterium]
MRTNGYNWSMIEEELRPYLNRPVRLTLDDGRVLAGRLAQDPAGGQYTVSSAPLRQNEGRIVEEVLPRRITTIEEAFDDPAAH